MRSSFPKRFAARLRDMSHPARLILKISLAASCVYLAAALAILIGTAEFTARNSELYHIARYLYTTPQSLLLVASIGSVIAEELYLKGRR